MPLMPPIPLLAHEHLHSLSALNAPLTSPTPPDSPQHPYTYYHPTNCPPDTLMPKLVFNCCHFATGPSS